MPPSDTVNCRFLPWDCSFPLWYFLDAVFGKVPLHPKRPSHHRLSRWSVHHPVEHFWSPTNHATVRIHVCSPFVLNTTILTQVNTSQTCTVHFNNHKSYICGIVHNAINASFNFYPMIKTLLTCCMQYFLYAELNITWIFTIWLVLIWI